MSSEIHRAWEVQKGKTFFEFGIDNTEEALAIINTFELLVQQGTLSEEGAICALSSMISTFNGGEKIQ